MGLVEEYLGVRRRTLYALVALMACSLVLATGIFIALFGFQHWRKNMRRAGSQMVIGFDAPAGTQGAVQYTCPLCGPVGLPDWTPAGVPSCPRCGAAMGVR